MRITGFGLPCCHVTDRLGHGESYSMILRKVLLLLLVSALTLVPILQAAHALTHVGDTDIIGMIYADGHEEDSEFDADSGIDTDRICLDCLALAGFTIVFTALAVFFPDQMRRQPLPSIKSEPILLDFISPYLTRGPPKL